MPELPEVETIARGLAKRITGDVIESIWLTGKPKTPKSPAQEIAPAVEHQKIQAIRRVGKHIVFDLDHVAPVPSAGKSQKAKRQSRAPEIEPTKNSSSPQAEANEGARPTHSHFIVHLGMTGRLQVCNPRDEAQKHPHAILNPASARELRFVAPRRFGRLSVSADFE